jgi:YtkA-like
MIARALVQLPFVLAAVALGGFLAIAACSSSESIAPVGTGGGGGHGPPGGPVAGPADTHCGTTVQPTSEAACHGGAGGAGGSGGGHDHGAGGGGISDYGPTLYNAEGDDDDCKYHVNFTSTDIYENQDVIFTVTLTQKSDGAPATGASPDAEVFLSDTHPAPNTDWKPLEDTPGVYKLGPIRFDAPGKWTVRFHFYESCSDGSEESPHGHVAFYVDVP